MLDTERLLSVPWLLFGFAISQVVLFAYYYRRPHWREHKLRENVGFYMLELALGLVLTVAAFQFANYPRDFALVFGLGAPAVVGGVSALLNSSEDARTIGYAEGLHQGRETVEALRTELQDAQAVRKPLVLQRLQGLEERLRIAEEEARRRLREG